MTHDAICPLASHPQFCEGCTPACGTCQCALIAKVRADERKRDLPQYGSGSWSSGSTTINSLI